MQYLSTKLFTNDEEAMTRFYLQVLGLPLTQQYDKALLLGQHLLITESGENGLYFEAQEFSSILQRLQNDGHPFSLRTTSMGQQIMTLTDPMGNRVEIGEDMKTVIGRLLSE